MVAYDSRRTPDPSKLLGRQTLEALRAALVEQRDNGGVARPGLRRAIAAAADEARARELPPETLLIQLKALADEVGLAARQPGDAPAANVREWMVGALLRAYWNLPDAD